MSWGNRFYIKRFNPVNDSPFYHDDEIPAGVPPVPEECYILTQDGFRVLTQAGDFVEPQVCEDEFVLTQDSDFVLTQDDFFVEVQD